MISMEIYYADLKECTQKEFDNLFGPPEEFNHAICPLVIYEVEDNDESES